MFSSAEASVTASVRGKTMLTAAQNVFVNDFLLFLCLCAIFCYHNKICLWLKYLIKEQMLQHDFQTLWRWITVKQLNHLYSILPLKSWSTFQSLHHVNSKGLLMSMFWISIINVHKGLIPQESTDQSDINSPTLYFSHRWWQTIPLEITNAVNEYEPLHSRYW